MFYKQELEMLTGNIDSYHPSAIARATFFYAYGAGIVKTKWNFVSVRDAQHDEGFLVVFTLSGRGELQYRGSKFPLQSKAAFFIDCSEQYQFRCVSNSNWEFLWVHFDGQNCLGYFRQYTKRQKYFISICSDFSVIPDNILLIVWHLKTKGYTFECEVSHCISTLLTELLVAYSQKDDVSTIIPQVIHNAVFEIENDFRSNLTLDCVAAHVGMTKYHFSREFKHYIGVTFTQYLINIRMEHAKKLLRETPLSIEQICYDCGMKTVSHFISTFKKREGTTPLAYRKSWNSDTRTRLYDRTT